MKPVAILQHDPLQRPGYLLQFLTDAGLATHIVRPAEGEDIPRSARLFSAVVVLGSDCSVNDPLPWIERELRLVKEAVSDDIPVLGHCFGGQLLARACGARVQKNPWPNIGWSLLRVTPSARGLFDGAANVQAFNWHYDTFAIPEARRGLCSARTASTRASPSVGIWPSSAISR